MDFNIVLAANYASTFLPYVSVTPSANLNSKTSPDRDPIATRFPWTQALRALGPGLYCSGRHRMPLSLHMIHPEVFNDIGNSFGGGRCAVLLAILLFVSIY